MKEKLGSNAGKGVCDATFRQQGRQCLDSLNKGYVEVVLCSFIDLFIYFSIFFFYEIQPNDDALQRFLIRLTVGWLINSLRQHR